MCVDNAFRVLRVSRNTRPDIVISADIRIKFAAVVMDVCGDVRGFYRYACGTFAKTTLITYKYFAGNICRKSLWRVGWCEI